MLLKKTYIAAVSLTVPLMVFADSIRTLKGVPVPKPSEYEISSYVANKQAAIALGKALFWDMQVGSDAIQSCATCHFRAGADNRSFNQVTANTVNSTGTFQVVSGPNQQLTTNSFSGFPASSNVISSQGICAAKFEGIVPGSHLDRYSPIPDPTYQVNGRNVRKVEPRNTPTVINAVFNHRNFWDGRAKNVFNGVSPFGDQDAAARVVKYEGTMQAVKISISNSSLASQAVGPPTSDFEMSFTGRTWPDVGRKMLNLAPLAFQKVSTTDSVLGPYANTSGNGAWPGQKYDSLVKSAFLSKWWNGPGVVVVNADRSLTFKTTGTGAANEYTQIEYNFSLFFGLAVQMYEQTLVADDSPFDRYDAGYAPLSKMAVEGKDIFMGKGKCQNCHGGPEFTNASVRNAGNKPVERMYMGNYLPAVYDDGFYNIAVRPTADDLGVGNKDPFGNPLSFARLFQKGSTMPWVEGDPSSLSGYLTPTERVAVDGAHKTASLHNVALTAPYFWQGDKLKLKDVVEFYNHGADFAKTNYDNLDPDIQSLGLSDYEKEAVVAFLNSLTDDRVIYHKAPFDHPSLAIPLGGAGCSPGPPDGSTQEVLLTLPEVGASGYSSLPSVLDPFLGVDQSANVPAPYDTAYPYNMSVSYNTYAIYNQYIWVLSGGMDGNGYAYNGNLISNPVKWNGQSFTLAAYNIPNAAKSKTITVVSGKYNKLMFLGAAVNGAQPNQVFKLTYSDGTSENVVQSLSDWMSPKNYPNEVVVSQMANRLNSLGVPVSGNTYIYGYTLPVNSAKSLVSVTMPANNNVVALTGMVLSTYYYDAPQTNPYPTTLLSGQYNMTSHGDDYVPVPYGGLDGYGNAYSYKSISSLSLNGSSFILEGPNSYNAMRNKTVPLAQGKFAKLRMIGTAVNGNQTNQQVKVNYTDGTSQTFYMYFSDWNKPMYYAYETKLAEMSYRLDSYGNPVNKTTYIYGYEIYINSTKTVSSVTLPANNYVCIMSVVAAN